MFDHYLHHQKPDPRRRKILSFALAVATIQTAVALGVIWISGKLAIYSVEPPAMSYVMVQMHLEQAPPPPPPPPPPAGNQADEDDQDPPDEPEPLEETIESPPDVSDKIPEPATPRGPRVLRGVAHGVPHGVGPLSSISSSLHGFGASGLRKPATAPARVKKPLAAVMANKVYQPPAPTQELLQTPSGRIRKQTGSVIVSFCISDTGKVIEARKTRGFPGDPQVDRIMLQWLKGFRFRPFRVGGKAQKICTEYKMNVRFR